MLVSDPVAAGSVGFSGLFEISGSAQLNLSPRCCALLAPRASSFINGYTHPSHTHPAAQRLHLDRVVDWCVFHILPRLPPSLHRSSCSRTGSYRLIHRTLQRLRQSSLLPSSICCNRCQLGTARGPWHQLATCSKASAQPCNGTAKLIDSRQSNGTREGRREERK